VNDLVIHSKSETRAWAIDDGQHLFSPTIQRRQKLKEATVMIRVD
jgi:hypothetical protein